MNKVCRCSIIILLVILVFVQIFCINKIKNDNNINACSVQNYKYDYKNIAQISNELDCINNKTILSANETEGKWHIKIRIDGDKNVLENEILKLKNYNIGNYIISKNKKENYMVLEITAR